MKRWSLVLAVAIVFGLVWSSRRDGGRLPDERIADHTRAMCKIAAAGVRAPDEGVQRLFRYYGDHAPTMAKEWAELFVIIERIDDDRAHDERARQAARRIHAPAIACARTFQQFAEAVEHDEAASARLQRGLERLGRTIEIISGNGGRAALFPLPLEQVQAARLDALVGAPR